MNEIKESIKFAQDYCEHGEERVYVLMAIAREKENPELDKADEIVFREVIKKPVDVRRKIEKLATTCASYESDESKNPTFRLYLSVNAKNTIKAYWNYRDKMNDWIQELMNGDENAHYKLKKVDSHWKSELQRPSSRDETKFLFDIDDKSKGLDYYVDHLDGYVADKGNGNEVDVVAARETPNGFHVITTPFNYNDLDEDFTEHVENTNSDDMIFLCYL